MLTTRNKVSSWFLYLGAVVGSTFGILEIFVMIMGLCEGLLEKFLSRKKRKIGVENVFGVGYDLKKSFNRMVEKNFLKMEITNYNSDFDECQK